MANGTVQNRLAVHLGMFDVGGAQSHQPLKQFSSARAHHSGDAQHLARANLEAGLEGAMLNRQPLDDKQRIVVDLRSFWWIQDVELAPNHKLGHRR